MIRPMVENDLNIVMQLENDLFTLPWKIEDYLYELNENKFSYLYVLEKNEKIVGYAGLWTLFEQAQVTTIGVSKEYQGLGYGGLLLKHLEDEARSFSAEVISLEVRVSNVKAQSLYKKYGFDQVALRKDYYSDNHEDAYLMMKGI